MSEGEGKGIAMTRGHDGADGSLREYLADRDVPCPGCGYNLRGLTGAVCPECRQELRLTVGLVEPRIGALVACLGPLFAGAGAGLATLAVVVIISMAYGRWPSPREMWFLVWVPLGCLVTCGGLAAVLGRAPGRAWLRNRSKRGRVMAVCAAVPAAWFVVFLGLALRWFR